MIKTYCVRLKPLEPYFFAGEKSFGFGKQNKNSYNNYFIKSELLPTQTTLLGTLRYYILKQKGILTTKSNNPYLEQEKYVGKNSFDMNVDNEYGIIKNISPMFLKDKENNIYIRTPYNQNTDKIDVLDIRNLKNDQIDILDGNKKKSMSIINKVVLKKEDEIRSTFVNLDKHILISEDKIFNRQVRVGINKTAKKEGFFKKEYIYLKDYEICFYVDLDDDEFCNKLDNNQNNVIVYMGMGKSSFQLTIEKEMNKLEDRIKELFKGSENEFYYALSDICVDYDLIKEKCDLMLDDIRTFRSLSTQKGKKRYFDQYKQSNLYHLIRAGSVFYVKNNCKKDFEDIINIKNLTDIGFNKIIKIGGK